MIYLFNVNNAPIFLLVVFHVPYLDASNVGITAGCHNMPRPTLCKIEEETKLHLYSPLRIFSCER